MKRLVKFLIIILFSSSTLMAETKVTTYVVKVQEERESTRFTLTEWLKIKERMKLMDVWLAMFSDPKKDQFQPELNVWWRQNMGDLSMADQLVGDEEAKLTSSTISGQLWLTNIVSSTVGIRMLNIDLGFEGGQKKSETYTSDVAYNWDRSMQRTYYTANFRLFGKNIQDSLLAVKYGQHKSKNSIIKRDSAFADTDFSGVLAGGELQLYLFKWCGVEGNYLKFGGKSSLSSSSEPTGFYYDYLVYIEISILRLTAGKYKEAWTFPREGLENYKSTEEGVLAGLKLLL